MTTANQRANESYEEFDARVSREESEQIATTYPRTDGVKAVQAYLESGEVPIYLIELCWKTERREGVVEHVKRHFNATAGDCIGLDVTVRDAIQNMALEGRFRVTDVRIVEGMLPPLFVFRSTAQADALLRQLEGRTLTDEAKQFLSTIANDLRLVIARQPYGQNEAPVPKAAEQADGCQFMTTWGLCGRRRWADTPYCIDHDHDMKCRHCHSRAKMVQCSKCSRSMCEDCISDGQLCGTCHEAEAK